MRVHPTVLIGLLFIVIVSIPVHSQTEVGVVVDGVISAQPSPIATSVTCVVGGCPPTATHVDNGVAIQGFVSRSIMSVHVASLSLELPVLDIPSRGTNLAGASFSTLAVTPGVRLSVLPHGAISPFLSAGAGIAHFSGDTPSVTKGAVLVGGGVDLKTHLPLLGIRVEVKDLLTPWPSLVNGSGIASNVLVGGGVVLRF